MTRLANPWLTMLLYAVTAPAVIYLAVTSAIHVPAEARTALATAVTLGGVTLAVCRYWSARPRN
jgi:hypothetical protein